MGSPEPRRRLVVNADDFGRSTSINEAVIRAHREGILTTASLMVGGEAFDEAVRLARGHPNLGVGLHLTLVCGRSVLPPSRIPGLVDGGGAFPEDAPRAGFRFWRDASLKPQLEAEIRAQVERFRSTGLELDHLNGHLHLHLHPVVFGILCANAGAWGIRRMRCTRDVLRLSLRHDRGRWGYRLSHALVFGMLSRGARRRLDRLGIRYAPWVVGLFADSRMNEEHLLRILPDLPGGDVELYSHPSLDRFRHEFEALISPRVKEQVAGLGLQLVRYQDL